MNRRTINNARQWAALQCMGTYELLMQIHAGLDDVAGAVEAGQWGVATYAARDVLLRTLGIRAVAAGALPSTVGRDAFFDVLHGVDPPVRTEALRLARRFAEASDPAELAAAQTALVDHVRATERVIGFVRPPAPVRHPEGLYPALRTTRILLTLAEQAQLPDVLPSSWGTASTP